MFRRTPLLPLALVLVIAQAFAEAPPGVTVAFELPDGTQKVTLTWPEASELLGENLPYMVDFWVRAALVTLDLPYETERRPGKVSCTVITRIGSVANDAGHEWVYSVDGIPSPYCIDNQLANGIRLVKYMYAIKGVKDPTAAQQGR